MSDPMAPIRAEVMAQPAHDRLGYALDLLAFYLVPVPAFYDGCADLGLGMARAELRILHALDAKRGRFVSVEALISARCIDRPLDEWTPPARIVTSVGVIRRRLAKLGLPVEIETGPNIGYRLHAPDTFRFETAAAVRRAGQ